MAGAGSCGGRGLERSLGPNSQGPVWRCQQPQVSTCACGHKRSGDTWAKTSTTPMCNGGRPTAPRAAAQRRVRDRPPGHRTDVGGDLRQDHASPEIKQWQPRACRCTGDTGGARVTTRQGPWWLGLLETEEGGQRRVGGERKHYLLFSLPGPSISCFLISFKVGQAKRINWPTSPGDGNVGRGWKAILGNSPWGAQRPPQHHETPGRGG